MMLRIRSRDGVERLRVDDPNATVVHLKTLIQTHLLIPITHQTLSTNHNLLLAKTPADIACFTDMADLATPLSSLNLFQGSSVYVYYDGIERTVPGPAFRQAGSFGRKMTIDDMITKQMEVTRQENPHCEFLSVHWDCANMFQHHVNENVALAVKRGGSMYGPESSEVREVEVNFIYEPPQQGSEENWAFFRDPAEEKLVEAIALGLKAMTM